MKEQAPSAKGASGKRLSVAVLTLVCVTAFIHVLGIASFPKSVNWDSARGILAAKQWEVERSPSPIVLVTADPDDLTQDLLIPQGFHAPGYQLVPLVFRAFELSWSGAIKVAVLIVLLTAVGGWFLCYRRIVRLSLHPWLLLLMVFSPGIVLSLRSYEGGDLLLYGYVPVLLLANGSVFTIRSRRVSWTIAALAGFLGPIVMLFKYSGLFISIGVGVAWLILVRFRKDARGHFAFWLAGGLAGGILVLALGYPWGATPSSTTDFSLRWRDAFLALGAWPFSMTDSSLALEAVLRPIGIPRGQIWKLWAPAIGLLLVCGGAVIVWRERKDVFEYFILSPQSGEEADRWLRLLFVSAFAVDTLLYAGMVFAGAAVDVSPRIARMSGLLMFPFVLEFAVEWVTQRRSLYRFYAIALWAVVLLPGPVLGGARVFGAVLPAVISRETWAGQSPHLRNERVGASMKEQERFDQELASFLTSPDTVLLVTNPDFLFSMPWRRCLLVYILDKQYTAGQLASMRFQGRPVGGVVMLLPDAFRGTERETALRAAFVDIRDWQYSRLKADPKWGVWVSSTADETGQSIDSPEEN